jgi:polyhydroxyalkanoate synthesis repressor PhaR
MPNERPTVIKKYANRRLYHTGTSTYVTLEDLAGMVKNGEEFIVQDAKTSEDITRAVLGQIIFEHEGRGQHLLPIAFLRQLIRFYGNSVQAILPTYLESALSAFTRDQEKLREQMSKAFQGDAFGMVEEQTRRNMELFSEAMRMWIPFKNPDSGRGTKKPEGSEDEIAALRRQLQEMQRTLENLDKGT